MAQTMLSITTSSYSDPSKYELTGQPVPQLSKPTDVIIKVHAGSINPIDVKKANGDLKFVLADQFPYKIGYDCAGIVTEVGNEVNRLKVGDEVYVRLPDDGKGAWSEYAMCAERYIALKPKSISFNDAASLPLAAMTSLQALRKYKGSLEGKTVFIPAGLSGTGAYACQLAKNVFHAGKVITTVSTSKVPQIPRLLGEGVVDQVIDYTTNDPTKTIPPKSVDFILDTTGAAMSYLHLMTPKTSTIISISTLPSGSTMQASELMQGPNNPRLPWYIRVFLDLGDAVMRYRARRWGVEYEYLFLESNAADLGELARFVEEGKLRPVVGTVAKVRDVEAVREACGMVFKGKGGVGKAVIEVIGG